jgi:hypothetical protein
LILIQVLVSGVVSVREVLFLLVFLSLEAAFDSVDSPVDGISAIL